MKFNDNVGLSYDDVVLEPQFSILRSRSEADTSVNIGKWKLKHPVVSANMDSVSGIEMLKAIYLSGSVGFLHRYLSPETTINHIKYLKSKGVNPICVSIGVGLNDLDKAKTYIQNGANWICIDIAHGHSVAMKNMLEALDAWRTASKADFMIIAGNVATAKGAMDLAEWGADIIKCGVANGHVCDTKNVSGHGVPQLSCVSECADALAKIYWLPKPKYLIADGGIRSSGDIVKALAAGAHLVMVGSVLSGTDECALEGVYRGMASADAQLDFRGEIGNMVAEGISTLVQPKGPVSKVIEGLVGGIRSGCSYSNAHNLNELRANAVFRKVTHNFNKK